MSSGGASNWLPRAVAALRRGLVVAAATESSYGLLADASSPAALDRLLWIKARGAGKSQPLIVPDLASARSLTEPFADLAESLAAQFWPGQLTLVLPARAGLDPRVVLDGAVAMRVPGDSPAQRLVQAFAGPLTATSANLPGEPPALLGEQVSMDFSEQVTRGELLVLPGQAPGGPPSSLVRIDASAAPEGWKLVRAGAVSEGSILQAVGAARGAPRPRP